LAVNTVVGLSCDSNPTVVLVWNIGFVFGSVFSKFVDRRSLKPVELCQRSLPGMLFRLRVSIAVVSSER